MPLKAIIGRAGAMLRPWMLCAAVAASVFAAGRQADAAEASAAVAAGPDPVRFSSVLGVRIGDSLESARSKLKDLGTAGGRQARGGAYKEAWSLNGTDFQSVAYKADGKGKIVWLTGFLRPGKEMPFEAIGDLARATERSDREVIWNVPSASGDYRLVAKGGDSKARVIYFLLLQPRAP